MGLRTGFCVVAGPLVLFAGGMQFLDTDETSPVKNADTAPIVEEIDPIAVTDISDTSVEIQNNTGRDIWMVDLKLEYYPDNGAGLKFSDPIRLFDIPSNEAQSVEVDFNFDHRNRVEHFRVVEERITILADDPYGDALRDLLDKRDLAPQNLTEAECYALTGYAPESPCDGFKTRDLSMTGLSGPEVVAALELIEDGTADYASEMSGR